MFALAIKLRVLSDDTQCHITMISEAPIRKDNPHMITLEKMLVDIYADKLISSTFSKAEYPGIIRQAESRYMLDAPLRRTAKSAEGNSKAFCGGER